MTADLIPASATEKHIAFLGATGSGKTSAAKRALVEPILMASTPGRVIILDPTGAWWGLRLKADGKGKGISIYIFGGDHGDYPLRARDAALLAETFATSSDSAIFDMSLMTVSERTAFFTEFAETIRRKNKGPLHLIIDEAHLFMPQAGAASGGAVPAMLHAGNNLVSLGRSRGLRIAMISQRPAKLHKDSLTQAQSLVAMRLMAPQDRKAIADWIADQADPEKGREIIASLPSLKPGEGWVWSPQDGILRHTKFPLPRTFDSSRAPSIADGAGPELAPVNMDALKGRLSALEAEAKANSPAAVRALNAEVVQLRAELANASPIVPPLSDDERQKAFQEGIQAGQRQILEAMQGLRPAIIRVLDAGVADIIKIVGSDVQHTMTLSKPVNIVVPPARRVVDAKSGADITGQPHVATRQNHKHAAYDGVVLPRGERAVLTAAAQHQNGVTRQQLTVLTGFKRSTRDAYILRLANRSLLADASGRIVATPEGIEALGSDYEPLPTGAALRDHVLRTLPAGEAKVLSVLAENYPMAVTRDHITEETGFKRSTRDAYLQRLAARELVAIDAGNPIASANLFD